MKLKKIGGSMSTGGHIYRVAYHKGPYERGMIIDAFRDFTRFEDVVRETIPFGEATRVIDRERLTVAEMWRVESGGLTAAIWEVNEGWGQYAPLTPEEEETVRRLYPSE